MVLQYGTHNGAMGHAEPYHTLLHDLVKSFSLQNTVMLWHFCLFLVA